MIFQEGDFLQFLKAKDISFSFNATNSLIPRITHINIGLY